MAIDFLSEYKKLQLKTPRLNCFLLSCINSDYCYNCENVKNGYLLANAVEDQDCMYGRDFYGCKDCNDCDHIRNCTLCYQCINSENCYNCDYLQDSVDSSDCRFGYYLKGCKNCIACACLRQKEFHIFNEPYSQADYIKKLATLNDQEIQEKFEEIKKKIPRSGTLNLHSENSSGNNLFHCKNVEQSYDNVECQDSAYLLETKELKDCFDITILERAELCYEISSCHVMYNSNCCFFCAECTNVEYSECLMSCQDCFGCISLHRKQYHILNEPYSKEEYFKKVEEIKQQLTREGLYGKMFIPPCFPKEDTVAMWSKM